MKARLATLGVVLGIVLCSAPVLAQTDDEAARAHFRSGTAYFERGDYDAALREFVASFEQSGRVELLYNVASCHERLENFPAAIEAFDRYLREATDVAGRVALEARVDRLRARVAATARTGADGGADGDTAGAPIDDEPPSGGVPVSSWVSWGVGVAGLTAFGVFGGLTLGESSELESTCGTSCSPDQVSSLETYALVADIGLAVGLVGAALGVVLLLVAPKSRESSARARLLPGRNGLQLALEL